LFLQGVPVRDSPTGPPGKYCEDFLPSVNGIMQGMCPWFSPSVQKYLCGLDHLQESIHGFVGLDQAHRTTATLDFHFTFGQ